MSIEQSIRDDIARELYESDGRYSWTWDELVEGWARGQENGLDPNYPHLVKAFREKADLILASPAIRRIQAEALRKAAAELIDGLSHIDPWVESSHSYLMSRADRIERGETA